MLRSERVCRAISVLIFGITLATGVAAQSIQQPPALSVIDSNGVNLATGYLHLPGFDVGIGQSGVGLGEKTEIFRDATISYKETDSYSGKIVTSFVPDTIQPGSPGRLFNDVSFGGQTYRFHVGSPGNGSGTTFFTGPYTQYGGGSARLECPNYATPIPNCTLILGDGTRAFYDTHSVLTTITKSDGEVIDVSYYVGSSASDIKGLKAVNSSLGWQLKYESNASYATTRIVAINTSEVYCDPAAVSCADAGYPSMSRTLGGGVTAFTRNGLPGDTYTTSGFVTTITSPGGVVTTVTRYSTGAYVNKVSQVTRGSSTWNYSYTASGNNTLVTVTSPPTNASPSGATNKWLISLDYTILSETDGNGRVKIYNYDSNGRISKVINPDGSSLTGGFTTYGYDARGNVILTSVVPKNGASLGTSTAGVSIVTSATYASACDPFTLVGGNFKYCNKPLTTTDANGITTTYTYHADSGNVATITQPAPAAGAVAPQSRYTYVQVVPHVKDSSGVLQPKGAVWRLQAVSSCMTLASCSDASNPIDQFKTSYTYDANHATINTTTITHGNSVTGTTATLQSGVVFNLSGDIIVTDGPQSTASDESYTFYDPIDVRRIIGTLSLDPDATGPLKRKATKLSYNNEGQVVSTEMGIAGTGLVGSYNGNTALARWTQAKADWDAMSVLRKDTITYGTNTGLPKIYRHYEGSTLTSTQQVTYDSLFRVTCQAERMNPAVPGSDGCVLNDNGTGAPDRITRYSYDALGNVTSTTSGFGTTQARVDFLKQYDNLTATSTGTLSWVEDAKGNRTSYFYDGFNRLIKTCYPSKTTIHTSATTTPADCKQISYRTSTLAGVTQAGTLTHTMTLRDGQVMTLGYDNLGRANTKSGTISITETFDNFDRVKSRSQNGLTESYIYDTAGWILSDTQEMGAVTYAYDAYGRRIRLTYPGTGLYVTYAYNTDGSLAAIKENGVTNLATYAYDDSSRPTSVSFGNGFSSNYTYDSNARLWKLNNTFSGGNNLITLGYSQANQITSRTQSNASYEGVAPMTGTTNYTANGLNQMVTNGSSNLAYTDNRGNMTSDGAVTYTYNTNNRLTDLSSGSALRYDAENRLRLIDSAATSARYFLYDGADLIAEYTSAGSLVRRYVHGPGTDNAIVMYEGAGTATKYFMQADERGSIVGVTNSSGLTQAIYSYDEYGVPRTNSGTLSVPFRYTGQAYLPEVALYNYKARMYAPSLGRFIQTDPLGYDDGMNMYAYVQNDPINQVDPFGKYSANVGDVCSFWTKRRGVFGGDPRGDTGTFTLYVDVTFSCNFRNPIPSFYPQTPRGPVTGTYAIPVWKRPYKERYKTKNGKEVRCESIDIIGDEMDSDSIKAGRVALGASAISILAPNPATPVIATVESATSGIEGTMSIGIRLFRGDIDQFMVGTFSAFGASSALKYSGIGGRGKWGKLISDTIDQSTDEFLDKKVGNPVCHAPQ